MIISGMVVIMLHYSLCLETPWCCQVLLMICETHLIIYVCMGFSAIKTELILFGVNLYWLVLGGVISACRASASCGNAEASPFLTRWLCTCLRARIGWSLWRVRVCICDWGSIKWCLMSHIFHIACLLLTSKWGGCMWYLVTISPAGNLFILKVSSSAFLESGSSRSETFRSSHRRIWDRSLIIFLSVMKYPTILGLGLKRHLGYLTPDDVALIV